MRLIFLFSFLITGLGTTLNLSAQALDSLKFENTILPIAFFLPETSLGLGITGITTFRNSAESENNRPSQFLYSAVYTFKNQLLLFAPYEIYTNNNTNRFKGELGYYRYFYNYYGKGSKSAKENLESYSVNFPRVDFSYAYTNNKLWFFGSGFKYDFFDIAEIKEGGLLETNKPEGYEGGTKLNGQAFIIRDKRNNILAPNQGSFLEVAFEKSLNGILTSFDYWKLNLDYRYYLSLKEDWTLACRLTSSHTSENTPFFDLAYISSPKLGRGFSDRRFTARNISSSQFELRFPIKNKFKASCFISTNLIYDESILSFNNSNIKLAGGIGFRYEIDKSEKTRLRLDIATGDGDFNIYLTMNEAF